MPSPFHAEREFLERALLQAGEVVMAMVRDGFEVAHKANEDPVTTADLACDALLKELLLGEFPDYGWLSEETRDDPIRLEHARVWIVDPIDGTREFAQLLPEFALSVALVEDGEPVVGGVYNPATDELFLAERGWGAQLNGEPVRSERVQGGLPLLLVSRSEVKRGEFDVIEGRAELLPTGSIAYKLALVAAGRVDGCYSTGPKHEWDVAAGVLLVHEGGGVATDSDGQPFRFNCPDTLVNGIFSSTRAAEATVRELDATTRRALEAARAVAR